MNKHRIGLSDYATFVLEAAEEDGFSKSEFVERCLKLGAVVCSVEEPDALPDSDAEKEDLKEWAHRNYPDKRIPDEMQKKGSPGEPDEPCI